MRLMRTGILIFSCLCLLILWFHVDAAALDVSADPEPELTSEALEFPTTELSVTSELSPTAPEWTRTPIPTLETFPMSSATSQILPTLDLTAAVRADTVLTLPAWAEVGDGRTNWEHTLAWSPQQSDTGSVWHLYGSSANDEILHWLPWIDLRANSTPVSLSFETQSTGTGWAQVEVSADGLNWVMLAVVPAASTWTTQTVDLSASRGSMFQLRFVWHSPEAAVAVDWWIGAVHVAETVPVLIDASVTPTASSVMESPGLINIEPESSQMDVFPCQLDVDADGVITEADFALISGQAFADGGLQSADFDLNGNQQIDIGDLQIMAQYRLSLCAN